jgi:Zn-dependent peptidase ImmA (M78 family)
MLVPGEHPLFVLNQGMPADRERFTLAHELGHLVMHQAPVLDAEREADRFAAEFLMPANEIRSHLAQIDLPKAATLKRYWKTAMSALIRRARDLGVIAENRYRSLCAQMAQRGFNRAEPVELPQEFPTLVDAVVGIHLTHHKYSIRELAAAVGA